MLSALIEYFKENPCLPEVEFFAELPREGYKMFKGDLKEAGIEYITEEGKCDFHALRHTFCTRLAKAGVQPQIAMKLARHSSIDLTMKHYTHFSLQDKSEAIQRVPEIEISTYRQVKTGTDDFANAEENSSGEKLAISAHSGNNRMDLTGQKHHMNVKAVADVSGCDIKKNTVKNSVLKETNNIDFSDTNWCRGGI